jgi:GT2 family glycosyltransferase
MYHLSRHSKQFIAQLEQNLLNADRRVWSANICQHITRLATQLAFLPDNQLDLYYYGLTAMVSLSPKQHVIKEIETVMPLLRGKQVQWRLAWQENKPISAIFIKLGTGNRVNHCQLVLSIFEQQEDGLVLVATAQREGATVQDGQWTELVLDRSLAPGKYLGQLQSPDADNQVNTLFLWLTVEFTEELSFLPDNLIDLYHYGLTPIMTAFPTDEINRVIDISLPVLRGKTLQWYTTLATKEEFISAVFLKLGTGGKINQCQLVLTIFKIAPDHFTLIATAKLEGPRARDNQWTELVLDRPLTAGQYICRLQSPDTDDTTNTLFIRLTTYGLENYCYVSPSPATMQQELAQLKRLPKISVIVPVNVEENNQVNSNLEACLNSVMTQVYPHWELCIATVGEDAPGFLNLTDLGNFSKASTLVQVVSASPANLLNQALTAITGDYFAILHPDDLLTQEALLEVAKYLNQTPETVDMLYSDEDKVNNGGLFEEPYFKPAWAKEMLKGQMYTGQLGIYRTRVVKDMGGFREKLYEQPLDIPRLKLLKTVGQFREDLYHQQIWDMVLRLTAQPRHLQHIPKILYHRRLQLPVVTGEFCKIVQEELIREGYGGHVTINPHAPTTGLLHYPVHGQPLVSIIIPTRDMATMLTSCLEAICRVTTYPHWELIIIDNGSQATATFNLFEKYLTQLGSKFNVIRHDIPFNFSKLVNYGVDVAKGEIILLLNNDTKIIGPPDWLQEMIGFAQHPEIAGVGCKLLYPQDNTIQHAGLISGIAGIANHGHKHSPANSTGYFNRLALVANYSAVTGACLMVKRTLWEAVNGFDENLAIAFNDVDFCLKLLKLGLRHVVLPQVVFYHHESKTRGLETTVTQKKRLAQEEAYMKKRWEKVLQNDPFYNPHLTRHSEDFTLNPESIYSCNREEDSWLRKDRYGKIPVTLYLPSGVQ